MILTINNLCVSYGAIKALHDVSLQVQQGEIVTLIGANGAGKTTLLRSISGLLRPTSGQMTFKEQEITRMPPHEIVRLGISHSPEGRQVFSNLTVAENLKLGAYTRTNRQEIQDGMEKVYTLFPVLGERRNQPAGTLSGGEQQMLAMARALLSRPQILLLDEPSLGLAPLVVRTIFQIIREINSQGTTIFLVEQNAHMALTVAHRAYVLQTGRIVKTDRASELLNDPEVKRSYLGG